MRVSVSWAEKGHDVGGRCSYCRVTVEHILWKHPFGIGPWLNQPSRIFLLFPAFADNRKEFCRLFHVVPTHRNVMFSANLDLPECVTVRILSLFMLDR